ncbi:MAG: hypothetical protein ACE5ET_09085 [Gammaproteobacteria bacterium]
MASEKGGHYTASGGGGALMALFFLPGLAHGAATAILLFVNYLISLLYFNFPGQP